MMTVHPNHKFDRHAFLKTLSLLIYHKARRENSLDKCPLFVGVFRS